MKAKSISKFRLRLKNIGELSLIMPFEIERDDTTGETFEIMDFDSKEQTFEVQIPMEGLPDKKGKLIFSAVKDNEILTKFEWDYRL